MIICECDLFDKDKKKKKKSTQSNILAAPGISRNMYILYKNDHGVFRFYSFTFSSSNQTFKFRLPHISHNIMLWESWFSLRIISNQTVIVSHYATVFIVFM